MMLWLRRLHAWIGLGLCVFLALIALTGAALVFRPELRDQGRDRAAPPDAAAIPGIIAAAERGAGGSSLTSVIFASSGGAWHEVRYADGRHAWVDGAGTLRPFTATDTAFQTLFDLHHQALAGTTGERVVGIIGAIGVLMVLSGLVLWWPARRSFAAAVIPRRPRRAGWLAAHRDLGVMVAPLVTLSLLTGAALTLPGIARPLMNAPNAAPPPGVKGGAGPTDWVAAVAATRARYPDAPIRVAIPAAKPGGLSTIRVRQPAEWHANGRTVIYLDPPTGRIVGVYDALAQSPGGQAYNAAWPVHAAKVGGLPWKLCIFLSGLSLAALSLYGGEAYRRRLMGGESTGPSAQPSAPLRPGWALTPPPAPSRAGRRRR